MNAVVERGETRTCYDNLHNVLTKRDGNSMFDMRANAIPVGNQVLCAKLYAKRIGNSRGRAFAHPERVKKCEIVISKNRRLAACSGPTVSRV